MSLAGHVTSKAQSLSARRSENELEVKAPVVDSVVLNNRMSKA